MAARFQTTVYNEKNRKIVVTIKDNVFSGMTYDFDTVGLQLQYDSESEQGQESFKNQYCPEEQFSDFFTPASSERSDEQRHQCRRRESNSEKRIFGRGKGL